MLKQVDAVKQDGVAEEVVYLVKEYLKQFHKLRLNLARKCSTLPFWAVNKIYKFWQLQYIPVSSVTVSITFTFMLTKCRFKLS